MTTYMFDWEMERDGVTPDDLFICQSCGDFTNSPINDECKPCHNSTIYLEKMEKFLK